jgi:hypothetical protein
MERPVAGCTMSSTAPPATNTRKPTTTQARNSDDIAGSTRDSANVTTRNPTASVMLTDE